MATLIAISTADGLVGRCDARCYEATCSVCECICGGRNHGVGRAQATDNTRALAERWIEDYTKQKGLTNFTTELHTDCQHPTLWSSA